MPLYKNVASQKVAVFAYDTAADAGKTGDAANITGEISKDGGTSAATNDTNPTELDATDHPGIYLFDLTQAETNADLIVLTAVSSTDGVQIDPVIIYTTPGNFKNFYEDAIVEASVSDATPSTTSFDTDLSEASDDHYNDMAIVFVDGNLKGQVRKVSDYDGTNKTVTVSTAFTEAPGNGDTFQILGRIE